MKAKQMGKFIGGVILAFGLGVLVSFFVPDQVLAVFEALIIIALGVLCFAQK